MAGQGVCPAGRAPESRRWWSAVRVEGSAPSDRQPFAALSPSALQHLPPALGLHPLAEAVSLLPSTDIRLKRSLHEAVPPRGRRTETVYTSLVLVTTRVASCDSLRASDRLRH